MNTPKRFTRAIIFKLTDGRFYVSGYKAKVFYPLESFDAREEADAFAKAVPANGVTFNDWSEDDRA